MKFDLPSRLASFPPACNEQKCCSKSVLRARTRRTRRFGIPSTGDRTPRRWSARKALFYKQFSNKVFRAENPRVATRPHESAAERRLSSEQRAAASLPPIDRRPHPPRCSSAGRWNQFNINIQPYFTVTNYFIIPYNESRTINYYWNKKSSISSKDNSFITPINKYSP